MYHKNLRIGLTDQNNSEEHLEVSKGEAVVLKILVMIL